MDVEQRGEGKLRCVNERHVGYQETVDRDMQHHDRRGARGLACLCVSDKGRCCFGVMPRLSERASRGDGGWQHHLSNCLFFGV